MTIRMNEELSRLLIDEKDPSEAVAARLEGAILLLYTGAQPYSVHDAPTGCLVAQTAPLKVLRLGDQVFLDGTLFEQVIDEAKPGWWRLSGKVDTVDGDTAVGWESASMTTCRLINALSTDK